MSRRAPRHRAPLALLALATALAPAAPGRAAAPAAYRDYAPVIDARPLIVTERIPEQREECTGRTPDAPAGDVRMSDPTRSLGAAIGAELEQGRPRCRTVVAYRSEERITAYEVRYRYRGRVYTRRMDHDPGERVEVLVEVSAVPAVTRWAGSVASGQRYPD